MTDVQHPNRREFMGLLALAVPLQFFGDWSFWPFRDDPEADGTETTDDTMEIVSTEGYGLPATELADGEAITLRRFTGGDNETLKVMSAGVTDDNGSTHENLRLYIQNESDQTTEYSTNSSRTTGDPLAEFDISNKEIWIAVANDTNGTLIANAEMQVKVE